MITVYLIKSDLNSNSQISDFAKKCVVKFASRDLCLPQEKISVKTGEHGKPYIDGYADWCFNISHTGGMIAIAVSDKPVGIDIEKIRKRNIKIAKSNFTLSENGYVNNAENDYEILKRFLEIWTKKEAYIKFTGEGLSRRLNSFSVFDFSENYKTVFSKDFILTVYASSRQEAESCKFYDFSFDDGIIQLSKIFL